MSQANYQYRAFKPTDLADMNDYLVDFYTMFKKPTNDSMIVGVDSIIVGEDYSSKAKRYIFKTDNLMAIYDSFYNETENVINWNKHIIYFSEKHSLMFENAKYMYCLDEKTAQKVDKENNFSWYLENHLNDDVANVCYVEFDHDNKQTNSAVYEQAMPYQEKKIVSYVLNKPLVIINKKGFRKTKAMLVNEDYNAKILKNYMIRKYGFQKYWELACEYGYRFDEEFYVIKGQVYTQKYTLEEIKKKLTLPKIDEEVIKLYNHESFPEYDLVTSTLEQVRKYEKK